MSGVHEAGAIVVGFLALAGPVLIVMLIGSTVINIADAAGWPRPGPRSGTVIAFVLAPFAGYGIRLLVSLCGETESAGCAERGAAAPYAASAVGGAIAVLAALSLAPGIARRARLRRGLLAVSLATGVVLAPFGAIALWFTVG